MNEFDLKAKDWDSSAARVERAQSVAVAVRERVDLSKIKSAMEYGCGTGLLSFELQPYIKKIVLADSSQGMLEVVAEKIKDTGCTNLSALQLDLIDQPIPDAKYDMIFTLMTMHHVSDMKMILLKFNEMINPGGFLLIADLDREDGSFHGGDFQGHKGFDRGELEQLLEISGFRDIKFSTAYTILKNEGKKYPVFLASAEKM